MMNANHPLLLPVIALVAWSLLIWIWMYATRLPAMRRAGIEPDPLLPRGEQMSRLPARVRWKADNYNHLMEQPTLFYAIALSLAVLGERGVVAIALAWSYVGLRIAHSLVQTLVNRIQVRFVLFALSTLPLFGLTWIAAARAWTT